MNLVQSFVYILIYKSAIKTAIIPLKNTLSNVPAQMLMKDNRKVKLFSCLSEN